MKHIFYHVSVAVVAALFVFQPAAGLTKRPVVYTPSPGASPTDSLSRDANGFYVFTPSSDSRIVYLSASGSDTNNCIYAPSEILGEPNNPSGSTRGPITPCLSLKKGYDSVRDGFPDHLYLKRGDTWNGGFSQGSQGMTSNWGKGGRSNSEFLVVGAWLPAGSPLTLPRPTLRINASGVSPFHAYIQSANRAHLAITDLHTTHDSINGMGANYSIRVFGNMGSWSDVIIQNNFMDKIGNNGSNASSHLEVQAIGGGSIIGVKIFGNIIAEATLPSGFTRNQGLYFSATDDIVLEKNTFYKNGLYANGDGYSQSHAMYIGALGNGLGNADTKVINNIYLQNSDVGKLSSANAEFTNNASFENSIGIIECCDPNQKFRYNTFNNARDYSVSEPRGMAFYFNPNGAEVSHNIMAHQSLGTVNVQALKINNPGNMSYFDNIVFNWCNPSPQWTYPVLGFNGGAESAVFVEGNDFQQQACQKAAFHGGFGSSNPTTSGFTFRNNNYYTFEGQAYPSFWWANGAMNFSQWRSSKEPTAVWQQKSYRNAFVDAGTYLSWLGLGNYAFGSAQGKAAYWNLLSKQDRINWNPQLEAAAYNDYVRYNFDKPLYGSGGGGCSLTPSCRSVDLDNNCSLNILDFVAMQNLFNAHDMRVDFDHIGGLTPNDFQVFQDIYSSCSPR